MYIIIIIIYYIYLYISVLLSGLLLSLQYTSSITSESLVLVWDDHDWKTRRLLTAHVTGWQRRNKTCCSFRRHSHRLTSTADSAEDERQSHQISSWIGMSRLPWTSNRWFSRYVSFPYLSISHFSKIGLTKPLKSTTQSQLSSWKNGSRVFTTARCRGEGLGDLALRGAICGALYQLVSW